MIRSIGLRGGQNIKILNLKCYFFEKGGQTSCVEILILVNMFSLEHFRAKKPGSTAIITGPGKFSEVGRFRGVVLSKWHVVILV